MKLHKESNGFCLHGDDIEKSASCSGLVDIDRFCEEVKHKLSIMKPYKHPTRRLEYWSAVRKAIAALELHGAPDLVLQIKEEVSRHRQEFRLHIHGTTIESPELIHLGFDYDLFLAGVR